MARVFLDANIFIDIIEQRQQFDLDNLRAHEVFVSTLSMHILAYLYKYKIPNQKLFDLKEHYSFVSFDSRICEKGLLGPTSDFEDNVQLHSCAQANCDFFLTTEDELLKTGFFGRAQIINSL